MTHYRFNDLSASAKQKVRERYGQDPDTYWADDITSQATEDGKALGFDIDEWYWGGFNCQGGGAGWKGRVDLRVWLDCTINAENATNDPDYVRYVRYVVLRHGMDSDAWDGSSYTDITTSGRYSHSYTMNAASFEATFSDPMGQTYIFKSGAFEGQPVMPMVDPLGMGGDSAFWETLREEIETSARDYADKVYAQLDEENDYRGSDEYIAEECEANDRWFDEDGDETDAPAEEVSAQIPLFETEGV
jgi:hypothetical protein